MGYEHILVERSGDFATVTMNRPQRRNALSLEHMRELIAAFGDVGSSDALGIVLAGNGPVFCAGHDFADVVDADLSAVRALLSTCTELMTLIQSVPQPVVARVHGLATAAGCQLVASADLAVASEDAAFAAPGGKGGWFCHTPMVAIARNVGRKRATELALSGEPIDARTALDWGLVNHVVPHEDLLSFTLGLAADAASSDAAAVARIYATYHEVARAPGSEAMNVEARAHRDWHAAGIDGGQVARRRDAVIERGRVQAGVPE